MTWLDRFIQRRRIAQVRPYLAPGARVLDVGSADGALVRLVPHLGHYVGIDPDVAAPGPIAGGQLVRGRFPADLPALEPCNAITLLAVLEHIPLGDHAAWARACYDQLLPGGLLLITVPSPGADYVLALLRGLRLIDGMHLEEHYGFDVRRTSEPFVAAGLELLVARRFQCGLNNLFVFRRPSAG